MKNPQKPQNPNPAIADGRTPRRQRRQLEDGEVELLPGGGFRVGLILPHRIVKELERAAARHQMPFEEFTSRYTMQLLRNHRASVDSQAKATR
jgi:hypothetical protein